MSLVALDGTPLVLVGAPLRQFGPNLGSAGSVVIDAANEACVMIGHIFTEDGSSHTIDTTGSSSLGWRTANITFANAGTTVKVGLAAVDTATGPAGRAVNSTDVITFDVSRSMTGGGGGITSNAWQEHVPTAGTKTIANGDLVAFCVQATARAGADSIAVVMASALTNTTMPTVTDFTGAAYANNSRIPNVVITFSDGTLGFFYGGSVFSLSNTTQTWNNTSGTKEYGNIIQMPFPAKCYGIAGIFTVSGNADAVLYSDPLGTPVAEKTVSMDLNSVGTASAGLVAVLFPSPFTMATSTFYAAILKPTSATNVAMTYKTFNAVAHQKSDFPNGSNCYAINRNTGAFAAQNSSKDRFAIGLLLGAFDVALVPPTLMLGI